MGGQRIWSAYLAMSDASFSLMCMIGVSQCGELVINWYRRFGVGTLANRNLLELIQKRLQ